MWYNDNMDRNHTTPKEIAIGILIAVIIIGLLHLAADQATHAVSR